ncbi:MAG: non-canonical purine NTP pyrophosphatase, RdgB/HAM1 family [Flavobacteriales bacterium]|nr:non-canonical purine NTP pyrophosphatase, RdgB/HAM1 family [Flavobacteriales bacterium]|tara:strand:- start:1997 stop:2581 length:585 start_codon:yes stop_codon:yes gene_type:complete
MKKIVFATNNQNKLKEVRKALPKIKVLSLKDIQCFEELPEEKDTLEGNAQQKAEYVYLKYGVPCFADDTGLVIRALDGSPGVYSARYAGPECDSEKNMDLVLENLLNTNDRNAHFKTVICFFSEEGPKLFDGIIEGVVLRERTGSDGFGYDPIFKPNGYNLSFAQMSMDKKNEISHRGIAVRKLIHFLKSSNQT